MPSKAIETFLAAVQEHDGDYPLSEAKALRIDIPETRVVIEEDGTVVALAVAVPHPQDGSDDHWSIEVAVEPSMRFPTFEEAVVEMALAVVPTEARHSIWSNRSTLDKALERMGYELARHLLYLTVDPPIHPSDVTRPLREDEFPLLIAANADAFAGHREAASLDLAELERLSELPWFDVDGIRVVDGDAGLAGFCWTKVHPNGDGEVYRIGVTEAARGQGLGRALLLDGYAYLFSRDDVARGSLWVDSSNAVALDLYRRIGMSVARYSSEYELPG